MKNMKRYIYLLLCVILAIFLLTACDGSTQEEIEALSGTWVTWEEDTAEQAELLLESIQAYEEEIALADMSSLEVAMLVEFDVEGNYRFAFDADSTRQCVRNFYLAFFEELYEGRVTLNQVYGQTFDDMTREAFYGFYAQLYACTDFDAMLDLFTENAYDYESLGEDIEYGTYTIVGEQIVCTPSGEEQAESIGYEIVGDTLKLIYADAEEIYTRAK